MTERRYGVWAGSKGHPEDPKCCIEQVFPEERGAFPHQCRRPRGHGPDGLYCKQHARIVEKEKKNADQIG